VGAALLAAGCTTTSPPTETQSAAAATTEAAAQATTVAVAATPVLATPAPERDPVAFFRAQQAVCAHHAAGTGNPTVEPDRFSGASWVRDPGDGAYLVQDGQGTRLVVGRATGIVLPTSGRPGDLMPAPCGFGCPETVFIGAADG